MHATHMPVHACMLLLLLLLLSVLGLKQHSDSIPSYLSACVLCSSAVKQSLGPGRHESHVSAEPALDLTFLLDHVLCPVTPLDWDAVMASPVPLKVGSCGAALSQALSTSSWKGVGKHCSPAQQPGMQVTCLFDWLCSCLLEAQDMHGLT